MDENLIIIVQVILVIIFVLFVVNTIFNEQKGNLFDFFSNEIVNSKSSRKISVSNEFEKDILIGRKVIKAKKSDIVQVKKDASVIKIKIRGVPSQKITLSPGQNSLVVGKVKALKDDSFLTIPHHPHSINCIYIKNSLKTNISLQITGETVEIPPLSSRVYKGRYENGIPLGSIIKNNDGIFSDSRINENLTHLIYGLN